MFNPYSTSIIENKEKHPINLLGDSEHYYMSFSPEYKNYAIKRPKLRFTELEFMGKIPLDDMR